MRLSASPPPQPRQAIQEGVQAAAVVARSHDMVRAFAIAPTASCSYRSKDREGFTAYRSHHPLLGQLIETAAPWCETFEYGDEIARLVTRISELLTRL